MRKEIDADPERTHLVYRLADLDVGADLVQAQSRGEATDPRPDDKNAEIVDLHLRGRSEDFVHVDMNDVALSMAGGECDQVVEPFELGC